MTQDSVPILDSEAKKGKSVDVPWFMKVDVDPEIVKRVYYLMFAGWHQPQSRDPMAGKRTAAESWGVDRGMARTPRIDSGRGKFAPNTVKGRLAHPPLPNRIIKKSVNKKERLLATLYAVSASANADMMKSRGHVLPAGLEFPIIFDDSVASFTKTSEVEGFLKKLGLGDELERSAKFRKMSGSPASRGRVKRRRIGPLFVLENGKSLNKAMRNIPGLDVMGPAELSVKELAPNGRPGRLVLWSQGSLEVLEKRLNRIGEKARVAVP
jgi:large subunit ribosomal protein L4e